MRDQAAAESNFFISKTALSKKVKKRKDLEKIC